MRQRLKSSLSAHYMGCLSANKKTGQRAIFGTGS
nr:MAG TPA: hypothetical protein [Caudoviricetes sp.]